MEKGVKNRFDIFRGFQRKIAENRDTGCLLGGEVRSHIGPTGGKLRSHLIISNGLSEKELY
jgi:hypothetical protein